MKPVPRYDAFRPASAKASRAARGSSRKKDTGCEMLLRRALWGLGLRYRVDVVALPGRPDLAFLSEKVAIFCDGDFWHGRDLAARLEKLARGHNAPYWLAKIEANVARDRRNDAALLAAGWLVLRFWESQILKDVGGTTSAIVEAVRSRQKERKARR